MMASLVAVMVRLSPSRLVKLLLVVFLLGFAAWRWKTSTCQDLAIPTSSPPPITKSQAVVLEELAREVERLRDEVSQKKGRVIVMRDEIEHLAEARQAAQEKEKKALQASRKSLKSSPSHSSQQFTRMNEVQPMNEYDVVPWHAFTLTECFQTNIGVAKETGGPCRDAHKAEMELVLEAALKSLSKPFTQANFLDGFQRTDRDRGIQYELYFQNPLIANEIRRVQVIRALGQVSGGKPTPMDSLQQVQITGVGVNIIVPVSGRLKHLGEFLDAFFSYTLQIKPGGSYSANSEPGKSIRLTFIAATSNPTTAQKIEETVKARCSKVHFPNARVVRHASNSYSLAASLRATQSAWNSKDSPALAFVVGLDHRLSAELLNHCRLLAQAGQRVFWPIAFRLYNPSHVYGNKTAVTPPIAMLKMNLAAGFWDDNEYGGACVAR